MNEPKANRSGKARSAKSAPRKRVGARTGSAIRDSSAPKKEAARPCASKDGPQKRTTSAAKKAGKGGTTLTNMDARSARGAAKPNATARGRSAVPPALGGPVRRDQQAINRELWTSYAETRDPALRERLILQYAPLVKYVMGRLALSLPAILDYEDILSYGTIGLIEAVERYDQDKGVKFETYAISRVRGAIIDALRALDRLPRSVRQRAKDTDAAVTRLTADLGREPTDVEVADSLGVSLKDYLQHIVDASWTTVSLDSVGLGNADDDAPGEVAISDPDAPEVGAELERHELIEELAEAIRELPEREQLVLSLYYKDELTMREVSKVLGISESRVCQLHARALSRLRVSMARIQQEEAA